MINDTKSERNLIEIYFVGIWYFTPCHCFSVKESATNQKRKKTHLVFCLIHDLCLNFIAISRGFCIDQRLVINSKILIKNTIKLAPMLLKQANGVSWMTIKFRAHCQRTQSKYQMSLLTNYRFCTIQITCLNIHANLTFPRSCGLQSFHFHLLVHRWCTKWELTLAEIFRMCNSDSGYLQFDTAFPRH